MVFTTILLRIVGELEEEGYMAVAVCFSDMQQVTGDM